MKKFLTVLLTVMIAFTTVAFNVLAEDEEMLEKKDPTIVNEVVITGFVDEVGKKGSKANDLKITKGIDVKPPLNYSPELKEAHLESKEYTVTFVIACKKDYKFGESVTVTINGNSADVDPGERPNEKNVSYTFTPTEKVAIPSPTLGLKYDGDPKVGVVVDDTWSKYTLTEGVVAATDAGEYSATFALKDTDTCTWSDGTTDPITVSWSIAKLDVKPKLNKENGKYTANKGETAEIQIVNYKDGMEFEYCLHDGEYSDLPVTIIDNNAYVYLAKGANHYHLRVKEAGNYTHKDHVKVEVDEKDNKGVAFVADTTAMLVGSSSAEISCTRDYYENPEAPNKDKKIDFDFLTIKIGNKVNMLEEGVDYQVEQGSTDVTFEKAYLDTLAVGEYEIGFHYKDGMHVEGKLIVNGYAPAPKKKSTYVAPKTGVQ